MSTITEAQVVAALRAFDEVTGGARAVAPFYVRVNAMRAALEAAAETGDDHAMPSHATS